MSGKNYRAVFVFTITLKSGIKKQAMDISPTEAIQKFLKELTPYKLTLGDIETADVQIKEDWL